MDETERQDALVFEQGKQLWTTSLEVAGRFGKRHDRVVDAIRRVMGHCSDTFRLHNFVETTYRDDHGREQPMVLLSRGGFSMVAMGFTGRDAVAWKEKFIAAFDLMERRILELSRAAERRALLDWQDARQEGKNSRRELAAVLADFVAYARHQGSRSADTYFVNTTRMVYRKFFNLSPEAERRLGHKVRDHLDARQLRDLATVEDRLALEMDDCMGQGLAYKTLFERAKVFVAELAEVLKPAPVELADSGTALATSGKRRPSRTVVRLPLWEPRAGRA
jgi:Rha family phage regulatory protein